MKHIHYNGEPTLTVDAVADAVIEYAAILGANGRTDTIKVPTFDEHGQRTTETLLIGPASQLTVTPAPDDELEDNQDDFVQHLRELATAAGPARPVHLDAAISDADPA
jgi:hypothetical protein